MKESERKGNTGIFGGLIWTFAERITAQLVSAIVGIILARLLMPEDYGVVSIVFIFITICDTLVTSGFGTALVQKQEASEKDFNTAFTMSLLMSVVLYALLFISAPYVATYYDKEILNPVIKVLGLRIIITAVNNIQHAKIRREMAFRIFFLATLVGTVISCAVGIIMAFSGLGVWALVAQYLTNSTIDTIALLIAGDWKPRICYYADSAKKIFSFGGKVLATNMTYTVLGQISSLLVGKYFGASELAYYNEGGKYPSLIISNIDNSMQEVLLPAYSKVQTEKEELKDILKKSIKVGIYVIAPLMLGLLAIADVFVDTVLTDKWKEMVPFIRIWCLIFLTRPFESSCHQAILGLGRSDTAFRIVLLVNISQFTLTMIAIFLLKSVLWVAIAVFIATWVSVISFSHFAGKLINYKTAEQIRDVFPSLITAGIMCILVFLMHNLRIHGATLLVAQILTGAVIYISISAILKLEPYIYLKNLLKEKLLKKNIPADQTAKQYTEKS